MPDYLTASGSPRSAAVINAEIRALARRVRERWTPEDLAVYVRLVAEERAAKAVEEATLAA
jgi:mevalonate pyrophosphate decarboxylase